MVLANAKEIQEVVVMDSETNDIRKETISREFEVMYMRGDLVILISPLIRTYHFFFNKHN